MRRRTGNAFGYYPQAEETGTFRRGISRLIVGIALLGTTLLAGIAWGITLAPATAKVFAKAQAGTPAETVVTAWSGSDTMVRLSLAQAKCTYVIKLSNLSSGNVPWEQLVNGKRFTSGTMPGKKAAPDSYVPMRTGGLRFAVRYTVAGQTTTIFNYSLAGTPRCN